MELKCAWLTGSLSMSMWLQGSQQEEVSLLKAKMAVTSKNEVKVYIDLND